MNNDEPSEPIELVVGEVYELLLNENPTTGYQWQVDRLEGADVALVDSEFVPAATEAVGAGGQRRLRLRAAATGTAVIDLKLARSWSGETAEERRLELHVRPT